MEKAGQQIGLGPMPKSEFAGLAKDEIAHYTHQVSQWTQELRTMTRGKMV